MPAPRRRGPRWLHAARQAAGACARLAILLLAGAAAADEPMEPMLQALRRRGLHDVALDYLASLRDSALLKDAARQTIPYEEGCSLVEVARQQRSTEERLKTLANARSKFEEFLQAQPDHPQAAAASIQLGNLLVERGRAQRDAGRQSHDKSAATGHLAEAAQLLAEARGQLASAESQFEDQLRALGRPAAGEDARLGARREELRRQLLQSRLFAAQALYEAALCQEPRSAEHKRLLDEAASAYAAVHEKYPQVLGGYYALLWQGRCLAEQRKWSEALALYDELRRRPEEDEDFRQLKAKALLAALDGWISGDPPDVPRAIEQSQAWLNQLRGAEDRVPDNIEIRWRLAQALVERARSSTDASEQAQLRKAGLAQAEFVAGAAGPRRAEARQLVGALTQRGEQPPPTSFADARQRAQDAVDRLRSAEGKVHAASADSAARAQAETERAAAAREAAAILARQIALRGSTDSLDDLNQARYYLAYVELQLGNRYAAAALGEFLARRYPQSPQGRGGAKIALAAFLAEYNRLGDVDRTFESERLENLARYLAETWPREPEANEAWLTLGDIAARERRFDDALAYFAKVGPGTPQRIQGDLAGGQIAWARYIEAAQRTGDERPPAEAIQQLLSEARARLEAAVAAGRNGPSGVTYTQLAAELSLAQLYAEMGEHALALQALDVENDGVLALVAKRHPLTERGNFPLEAQKVALRAAVGAGQLDRAQAVLEALGDRAESDSQGQAALARLYLALGRELQQQVERLQRSGRPDELAKLLGSFELFLQKLSQHPQEASYESLEWAADTWHRLGSGLADGDTAARQRSRKYLAESGRIYAAMLDRAAKEPDFLPRPEQRVLLELRGASALRASGRYPEALDQALSVLKRSPNQLEAQIEAAKIYQDWGAKAPEHYLSAMTGARPVRDKEGREFLLVWGWAKLANALQRTPQQADRFLEARYNLAQCRYRWALTREGNERAAGLDAAERDIVVTSRLKSDLGGPQWHARFDALARSIQQSAGRRAEGIRAQGVGSSIPQTSSR